MNPLGTIPVLIDGDYVLSDSHAIMIYLLSKYGGNKSETLYPNDLQIRAAVNQALFFDAGVYFIRLKVVAVSYWIYIGSISCYILFRRATFFT